MTLFWLFVGVALTIVNAGFIWWGITQEVPRK